mgnify:FL=1|tara:strand:+ start:16 stop:348 length:333 start_codon:yes stop_codon:yes gene_type:complete
MAKSINDSFKEYWLDIAGTTDAKNFNDAMRAGLTAAGYSGGLGKMLKAWAVDQGGSDVSINGALKLAFSDMVGESATSMTSTMSEYVSGSNWNEILIKFEDEDRQFSLID